MGKHDVERVKAVAGAALTARQPDEALTELALAPGGDAEVVLLQAEAIAAEEPGQGRRPAA